MGGIAIRCYEKGYPLLSVIAVEARTRMPSVDAVLYQDLGLSDEESIKLEKAKCFAFDWSLTALVR